MNKIQTWLSTRQGRLLAHDAALAAGVGVAAWQASGGDWTWGAFTAAGVVAAKAFLRLILPVPGKTTRLKAYPAVYHHRLPERPIPGRALGRHVHHDERSKAYPFHAGPTSALKSIRHKRHVGVYNQGDVGSCTGNAGAGSLSTAPFTHRYTESKALKLYSAAEVIDGDGPYPPNDNGSSGLSIAKVCKSEGLIGSYSHCFSAEAVYTALQTGPVMVGVNWLTGFDNPTADGQMIYKGSSRGGHELCMDEIDVENQRVWICNSWSSSWGIEGRAWWSFADFAKVLADQGDATVLDR